jgi:hypothetical protein
MTAPSIALTGFALLSLRSNHEIVMTDSAGHLVALRLQGVASEGLEDLRAVLSADDLDTIERDPSGVAVVDTALTGGWQIRMATS